MYTRYIPQPDGSYRRSRMPDPQPPPPPKPPVTQVSPVSEPHQPRRETEREAPACPYSQSCPHRCTPPKPPASHRPKRQPEPESSLGGVGSFLRQLLPKDFDTEDLLIVLLLLLMSGDKQEDQNSALLTLALYLFL